MRSDPLFLFLCGLRYSFANNKNLLYSTGNYIQYLIINYNGKELEKEEIYIHTHLYVKLNHCAVHLKLVQYCKSTILQF